MICPQPQTEPKAPRLRALWYFMSRPETSALVIMATLVAFSVL